MIVVRSTFVAKPGQASKLAALFKTAGAAAKIPRHRVLTDVTGDFNRVVFEYEVDSVAAFETQMAELAGDAMRAALKGYTDLYQTGTRELFRVA